MNDYHVGGRWTDIVSEMTFSIYGKGIKFAWDPDKEEWISKELLELQETAHQAVQLWAFIGLGMGFLVGTVVGFLLAVARG